LDSLEYIEKVADTGIGIQVALQLTAPEITSVIGQLNGFAKLTMPISTVTLTIVPDFLAQSDAALSDAALSDAAFSAGDLGKTFT